MCNKDRERETLLKVYGSDRFKIVSDEDQEHPDFILYDREIRQMIGVEITRIYKNDFDACAHEHPEKGYKVDPLVSLDDFMKVLLRAIKIKNRKYPKTGCPTKITNLIINDETGMIKKILQRATPQEGLAIAQKISLTVLDKVENMPFDVIHFTVGDEELFNAKCYEIRRKVVI